MILGETLKKIEEVYRLRLKNEKARQRLISSQLPLSIFGSKETFSSFLIDLFGSDGPESLLRFLYSVELHRDASKTTRLFAEFVSGQLKEADLDFFLKLRSCAWKRMDLKLKEEAAWGFEELLLSENGAKEVLREAMGEKDQEKLERLSCFLHVSHLRIRMRLLFLGLGAEW